MSASLFSLKGKVALITGATNGIGQGMAIGLAEAGVDQLIFVHREATDPNSTIDKLTRAHPDNTNFTVSTIVVDLVQLQISDIDKVIVQKAIELSQTGKIDILINNAGISHRSEFVEFDDDQFDQVLKVNMRIPAKLTQLVGKHMLQHGIKGKVIFTASLMSFQGGVLVTPYAIAKGGLRSFIQALSNEWASKGINVNGIAPGYISTNMTKDLEANPVRSRQIGERIPAGRWGKPEDFKGPTVFLCSSASDYVSGELLVVDGGWMGR